MCIPFGRSIFFFIENETREKNSFWVGLDSNIWIFRAAVLVHTPLTVNVPQFNRIPFSPFKKKKLNLSLICSVARVRHLISAKIPLNYSLFLTLASAHVYIFKSAIASSAALTSSSWSSHHKNGEKVCAHRTHACTHMSHVLLLNNNNHTARS